MQCLPSVAPILGTSPAPRCKVTGGPGYNSATLSGGLDIVVVLDEETATYKCSPFHVRFGKTKLLRNTDTEAPAAGSCRLHTAGERDSGDFKIVSK